MATGNPYLDAALATQQGNYAGAQQATAANRINQSTPYANLNYTQSTDANGNPVWTANQSLNGPLGGALNNISQNVANTTQNPFNASAYQAGQVGQGPQFNQIGNAQQAQGVGQGPQFNQIGNSPNLQSQVQGTGMEGWDRATALINQRLAPQMAQAAESNTAALANQGIVPGTKAYENAMRTFNQGQNDLQTQAKLAGLQVQNTMFGQNLAAGQFGNQALTQQNTNQLANLGFNNATGQQGYQNQLAGTQLGNQAAQQNYTNQLAGLGFNNATGQQGFANQLAGTQANNAAQGQNFTQNFNAYNNPLQQLGSFQQATQPGYVNPYSQAAVSGPDYLGAYSTQNAAAIAAQNAANAKSAGTTAGFYGLGSAALLGGGGIGGLSNIGSSAIGGLSGLGGLSQWFNNLGGDKTFGGSIVPDTGFASQIGSDFYGSSYDPSAGWSI